jgi:hypothetical protein
MRYSVIRIDYTQINNIELHLKSALNSNNKLYFSTPSIYKYISDKL